MDNKPFIFDTKYELKFILSNLDDWLKDHRNDSVTTFVFDAGGDISKTIKNLSFGKNKFVYREGKGFSLLEIFNKGRRIQNLIFPLGNSNLYLFLNFQNLRVMRRMSTIFLDFYTEFSKVSFTSRELENLLGNLESTTEGRIISKQVIYKEAIKNVEGRITDITWTQEEFKKSFESAIEKNEFIDKIKFELRRDRKSILNGYLTREGIFKFNGNFSIFLSSFLENSVMKIGVKKSSFLRKNISEKFDGSVKSLRLKFSSPVFEEHKKNKEFIYVLSLLKDSLHMVHHGNPYLHVSVSDLLDGSSFDLISFDDYNLHILSKDRSSLSSVNRIINHIFENFYEGEIQGNGSV